MRKINKIIIFVILILLIYNVTFAKYKLNHTFEIAKINIDNTPPNIHIQYVENDSFGIKVVIISDEEIKNIDGWNLINNTILEKEFWENVDFNIDIQDLEGNVTSVNILIQSL